MTLELKPPAGYRGHISDYYIEQFDAQSGCEEHAKTRISGGSDILVSPASADVELGAQLLKSCGIPAGARPIIIQPGSGGREKCWCIDNFLAIAHDLARQGSAVLFLLGPAELERFSEAAIEQMSESAPTVSNLPLEQVVAILSRADAFVGNDSGITHLAAAMGIRTVGVYGPTDPTAYGPRGPLAAAISCPAEGFTTAVLPQKQLEIRTLLG
jgi:ADP-heptose:LPS heptosyltransferase